MHPCQPCYSHCVPQNGVSTVRGVVPPVPPHGCTNHPRPENPPRQSQPRAVTLPHNNFSPCDPHSLQRPRYGSLPHQQNPPRPAHCVPPSPSPNAVGVPILEEAPPPLPPHGPPQQPPEHLRKLQGNLNYMANSQKVPQSGKPGQPYQVNHHGTLNHPSSQLLKSNSMNMNPSPLNQSVKPEQSCHQVNNHGTLNHSTSQHLKANQSQHVNHSIQGQHGPLGPREVHQNVYGGPHPHVNGKIDCSSHHQDLHMRAGYMTCRPAINHGPQHRPALNHGPQPRPALSHGHQPRPVLSHGPQPVNGHAEVTGRPIVQSGCDCGIPHPPLQSNMQPRGPGHSLPRNAMQRPQNGQPPPQHPQFVARHHYRGQSPPRCGHPHNLCSPPRYQSPPRPPCNGVVQHPENVPRAMHPQGPVPLTTHPFHPRTGHPQCRPPPPSSQNGSPTPNEDFTDSPKRAETCGRSAQVDQSSPPPAPPMPPPPVLPPVTYDQLRYACLPHQVLVPPPRPQEFVLGCPEHGHHHISAASKVDRPYCGPGPPEKTRGPHSKSNGIEGHHLKGHHLGPLVNGNHHHMVRRPQAVSQSAMMGGPRHPMSSRAVVDDSVARNDRWRRNVSQTVGQSYELSQDLADKRVEMLERRYGGDRARRAATTIQRAYRHYKMRRKFIAITETAKAHEKRLSRRLTLESIGSVEAPGPLGCHGTSEPEQRIPPEYDKLNKNRCASGYATDNRRPSRSMSMRDPARACPGTQGGQGDLNEESLYCSSPHTTGSMANGEYHHTPGVHHPPELRYNTSEDSGFISQNGSTKGGSGRSKSSLRSGGSSVSKKSAPELPRRSSSIKSESGGSVESFTSYTSANFRVQVAPPSLTPPSSHSSEGGSERGVLRRSAENGSLSSVQSSGSDSSLSQTTSDRGGTPLSHQVSEIPEFAIPTSPVWKRKSQMSEVLRKRQYRVGLNLFNKKSEKGINYLIGRSFLENSPQAVSKFLLTRKGLSKQMIGEYLGNLQNPFNSSVLDCFANEIDLSGMPVDVALRKFQAHFRMPGEAQKIERLMQVFAQRYCQCNRDFVASLRDPETVFVLAFAIIMLNTDLHTASLKPEKRMKLEEFIKNLRGVDDGCDIDKEVLEGMYNRIKTQEFRPAHDHVTQVLKVQQTIVGKKPVLSVPHRRLVCYCRLYEVTDPQKKERPGLHQREVFLFNDLLVVTKIFSKKKNSVSYTFRNSFPLAGLSIATKEVTHYPFLLEVKQRVDNKVLVQFNARNEHDRSKFCEDLRESILEMDEMENLRIEGELERQKANVRASRPNSTSENRDSGVADMELITIGENCTLKPENTLKRSTLSNSLLDIHESGNSI